MAVRTGAPQPLVAGLARCLALRALDDDDALSHRLDARLHQRRELAKGLLHRGGVVGAVQQQVGVLDALPGQGWEVLGRLRAHSDEDEVRIGEPRLGDQLGDRLLGGVRLAAPGHRVVAVGEDNHLGDRVAVLSPVRLGVLDGLADHSVERRAAGAPEAGDDGPHVPVARQLIAPGRSLSVDSHLPVEGVDRHAVAVAEHLLKEGGDPGAHGTMLAPCHTAAAVKAEHVVAVLRTDLGGRRRDLRGMGCLCLCSHLLGGVHGSSHCENALRCRRGWLRTINFLEDQTS